MKTLFMVIISIFLIYQPVFANSTTKTPKTKKHLTNTTINNNSKSMSKSKSKSNSESNSSSSAKGGNSSAYGINGNLSTYTGNNTITSNINERTQFTSINTSNVQIGSVSKPTSNFYLQGQTEDDYFAGKRSNAIQAGIIIPITWGTGVNDALDIERQHLKDRNLHERELHQAEMARICMELHKYVLSTGTEMSPELWNRCKGFEHSNNERTNKEMTNVYPLGRHNQEMNEMQISPHNETYHK